MARAPSTWTWSARSPHPDLSAPRYPASAAGALGTLRTLHASIRSALGLPGSAAAFCRLAIEASATGEE